MVQYSTSGPTTDGTCSVFAHMSHRKMVQEHPVHLLVCSDRYVLLAFDCHLQLFPVQTVTNERASRNVIVQQPILHRDAHSRVKQIVISPDSEYAASSGDDKLVHLWKLPSLEIVGSRLLGKKANTLTFSMDSKYLIVGDKLGDAWSFTTEEITSNPQISSQVAKARGQMNPKASLTTQTQGSSHFSYPHSSEQESSQLSTPDASKVSRDEQGEEKKVDGEDRIDGMKPILGHVSLLTSIQFTPDGKRIISTDRDEHVRISRWPNAFTIEKFLCGHDKFVSASLVLDNNTLVSGGGDNEAFIWNLEHYTLQNQCQISKLAEYSLILDPRNTKRMKKSGENEMNQKLRVAVNNIVRVGAENNEEFIVFSSTGSSALATFRLKHVQEQRNEPLQPTSVQSFKHPVLALSSSPSGKSLIASLDVNVTSTTTKESTLFSDTRFTELEINSNGVLCQVDGTNSLAENLNSTVSLEVAPEENAMDEMSLYGDLFLLFKETSRDGGDMPSRIAGRVRRREEEEDVGRNQAKPLKKKQRDDGTTRDSAAMS